MFTQVDTINSYQAGVKNSSEVAELSEYQLPSIPSNEPTIQVSGSELDLTQFYMNSELNTSEIVISNVEQESFRFDTTVLPEIGTVSASELTFLESVVADSAPMVTTAAATTFVGAVTLANVYLTLKDIASSQNEETFDNSYAQAA